MLIKYYKSSRMGYSWVYNDNITDNDMAVSFSTSHFFKCFTVAITLIISACSSKVIIPDNPPNFLQAKIYINQVAFDLQAPKHAVISLPLGETASRFMIYQGKDIIYQGKLSIQPTFTDWGDGANFYLADFSAIKRRGEYQLVINIQKQQLKSSSFVIRPNATFDLTAKQLISYFNSSRHTQNDSSIEDDEEQLSTQFKGGWQSGQHNLAKSLSSQNQSNYFVSQEAGMATWAMAKSYSKLSRLYNKANLTTALTEEVMWGADYLHRTLSIEGFFINSTFLNSQNSESSASTQDDDTENITANNFRDRAAFREGGGMAIAALARAYELSKSTGIQGDFSAQQYLIDAEYAFAHLQKNNLLYLDDGKENIIDDYTALIAATELFRITKKTSYLKAARYRAHNLNSELSSRGWFVSDSEQLIFNHFDEAGFPVIALVEYLAVEYNKQIRSKTKRTIKDAIDYQLTRTLKISNPFNLARQSFTFVDDNQSVMYKTGFFMPHNNITSDFWQGENARLASLTTATIWGGKYNNKKLKTPFGIDYKSASFAQSQIDWIMGKNPYNVCMLDGLGINNPQAINPEKPLIKGGISNGITGTTFNNDGTGMTWAEGPEENNWRWTEQRIQNAAWYLLAITAITE